MVLVIFLLVISVLVFVHELGHFLVARAVGARVFEFGIGFPPRALKLFTRKGTEFTLNWIPFGGFVKIAGEDAEDTTRVARHESLAAKPIYQRIAVLLAGVAGNVLLGWILFWAVFATGYFVSPVSPEALKGVDAIHIPVTVQGADAAVLIPVRTKTSLESLKQFRPIGFFEAGRLSSKATVGFLRDITKGIGFFFRDLFVGKPDLEQVAGPVGIAKLAQEASSFGFGSLLLFVGILSFNLAILNLLPIPALDGGRIFIILGEAIARRKISERALQIVHTASFIFLILIMILVTYTDIVKLFS